MWVKQDYRFNRRDNGDHCEPSGRLPCARFWPTVTWGIEEEPTVVRPFVDNVRIIQRLEFGLDSLDFDDRGGEKNRGDIFRDRFAFGDGGVVNLVETRGDNGSMKYEDRVLAIDKGRRTGTTWDSWHQTNRSGAIGPGLDPGCAECLHVHWAWRELLRVLPGFTTDGNPQILNGSQQTTHIAAVKYSPDLDEVDPWERGYEALVDTTKNTRLDSGRPVMFWDMSTPRAGVATDRVWINGKRFPLGDAAWPQLTHKRHGGNGSMYFAPARILSGVPASQFVLNPQWSNTRRIPTTDPRVPAGWVLPIEVTYLCGSFATNGGGLIEQQGPFWISISASANAGQRLLNPEAPYVQVAGGTPYLLLRDDRLSSGSTPSFRPGKPIPRFPCEHAAQITSFFAYAVFSVPPLKENVKVQLLGTPDGLKQFIPFEEDNLPAAPIGLRSAGQSSSSVTLEWNPVTGATGYRVYRGDALVAQVSGTTTTIRGLKDNTAYTFSVSAFNAAGESARSSPISVRTLPTWKFAFVSQQVYDEVGAELDVGHVRPGERGRVVIKVRNIGSATWTRNDPNPVLLGIWPESRESSPLEQDWFRPNRPAKLNETEVKQGDIGTFEFWIKVPSEGVVGPVEERFNLVAEGLTWFDDRGLRIRFNVIPVVGMATTPDGGGYWLAAADGGVFTYGNARFFGSAANQRLNKPVVGMATTPNGRGYWLAAADGGVFSYGNARFYGSAADVQLQKPVVGMAATPDGGGYWLVAADGGVFTYGNARFHGSMGGKPLNQPVVGMAATPDGGGYWLVAADGGVFSFGNAKFHGSAANERLQKPVVGMAATPDGGGYWLVAADGGVFSYGNAKFHGSAAQLRLRAPVSAIAAHPKATGYWLLTAGGDVLPYGKAGFWGSLGLRFKKPVVGITATPDGSGYWLAAADGGVFSYGNTRFHGSAADLRLRRPVVGMAATPDGGGYWLAAADGGVFSYGNAQFHGSAADVRLQKPVVGMAPTPDGGGYWLVAADGGVFTYGNARFHGSATDVRLQKPVVGMAATPDGGGYWLVAADGGVFSYGNAKFYGSAVDVRLNKPVVGMAATPDGGGYWLVAADGGVFSYGNAPFYGSAANDRLRKPVVGIAAHPQGKGYWLATSDGTVRHFIDEDSQTRDIPPPPTDWQLNGAARINGDDLVLTPAENDTAGTAFYKQAVKAEGLQARFTAVMDGGSGADGLTLALLDPASAATTDVGGTGGLLGVAGLAGAAVALDTWPNLNDPSDNFVGVAQGTKTTGYNEEGPLWLATATEVPRLLGSHQVEVTYAGGRLKVRIDGNQVLDTAVELPTNVLVGFTAATGNATNVHTIRDVTITPDEGGSPPRVS